MNHAKVIVTSDSIKPWDLFLLMRKYEKLYPKGMLSGLSEKIIIHLEDDDFLELMNP